MLFVSFQPCSASYRFGTKQRVDRAWIWAELILQSGVTYVLYSCNLRVCCRIKLSGYLVVLEALSINATMQTAAQAPVTLRNQNLDRKEMFRKRSSASVHFIHSPRAVGWLCNAVRTDCCTWRIATAKIEMVLGMLRGYLGGIDIGKKGSFLSDSRNDMKLLSRNPIFAYIHLMLQIQPHCVNCANVQGGKVHHKV